jgi:hypothetical protein
VSNDRSKEASALVAEGTIWPSIRGAQRLAAVCRNGGGNSDQSSRGCSQGPPQGSERRSLDPALSWCRGRDYWLAPGRSSQPSPIFRFNTSVATCMLGSLLDGPKEHGLYCGGE